VETTINGPALSPAKAKATSTRRYLALVTALRAAGRVEGWKSSMGGAWAEHKWRKRFISLFERP
jgi:hypothetical protein